MTSRSLHVVSLGLANRLLVPAVGAMLLLAPKGWGDSVTKVSRIQAGGRGTLYIGNRAALVVPDSLPEAEDAPPLKLPETFPIRMNFWSLMGESPDQF